VFAVASTHLSAALHLSILLKAANQMSWGVRLTSISHLHIFFRCLAAELCSRAAKANVRGSLLTLKLWIKSDGASEAKKFMGHGICFRISKSGTLPHQSSTAISVDLMMPPILECFNKCSDKIPNLTADVVRGVGISMSQLQSLNAPSSQDRTNSSSQAPSNPLRASRQPSISFGSAAVIQHSNPSPPHLPASSSNSSKQSLHPSTTRAQAPGEKRQWQDPQISLSQLDHSVLAALPPELRIQVQDDAKKVSALKRQKNGCKGGRVDAQLEEHYLDSPRTVSRVLLETLSIQKFVNASSTGNATLEELLQLKRSISHWMAAGPPGPEDVKLVGRIIRVLVTTNCMDSLRSFLLALARCAHSVEPGSEKCQLQSLWVEWVGRAIEFAQRKVFAEHGAALSLL
jgi:hypothetical protein